MSKVILSRSSNQALGLGKYAIDFLSTNKQISKNVLERVKLFHTDSVVCGLSALSLRTNAPHVLRSEALENYKSSGKFKSKVFGSQEWVSVEKAIAANASAVREWDSNGTVFGYNEKLKGHQAGEFGHNDYYPVAIAGAQVSGKLDGEFALKGMLLIDEIRGRLAEVFSLKTYKIDHVVHGAIASAATFGAMIGATPEEIESAIGMVVAHYIPFRAIRAGKQLSDSKGASAALSTEAAVISVLRSMRGFVGPKDIFRNPEAIFRFFEKTNGDAPFDIVLETEGEDFSVMGMHFKLGLYEHQSAGAIQGVINLVSQNHEILDKGISHIKEFIVTAYEPAFGIIGDPAKRDPKTRQSADHSMVFIISRLLKKAIDLKDEIKKLNSNDELWKRLILTPDDYSHKALHCAETREIMKKIKFVHGGKEYDSKYPEGIPTKVDIVVGEKTVSSGLVMFPSGHARNTSSNLKDILRNKNSVLLNYSSKNKSDVENYLAKLGNIESLRGVELEDIYNFKYELAEKSIDSI